MGSQLLGTAPLVVPDVREDVALGERRDEVVRDDGYALGVGGLDGGHRGVGADGVDAEAVDALLEELLDGRDEGSEVTLACGGLDIDGPAHFLATLGGAIGHGHVERAREGRRHEADGLALLVLCCHGRAAAHDRQGGQERSGLEVGTRVPHVDSPPIDPAGSTRSSASFEGHLVGHNPPHAQPPGSPPLVSASTTGSGRGAPCREARPGR